MAERKVWYQVLGTAERREARCCRVLGTKQSARRAGYSAAIWVMLSPASDGRASLSEPRAERKVSSLWRHAPQVPLAPAQWRLRRDGLGGAGVRAAANERATAGQRS